MHQENMMLWSAMVRLLCALAVLGLFSGSLVAPVKAAPEIATMSMADNMSCCPQKQLPDCGKSCPLAVLCLSPSVPAVPAKFGVIARLVREVAFILQTDLLITGLGEPPLQRPPRI